MEKTLVDKIDNAEYSGANGAVHTARKVLRQGLYKYADTETKVISMLEYINVLYSAMTFFAKRSGLFAKLKALWYAVLMTKWTMKIDTITSSKDCAKSIGAGGFHVMMMVWMRDMQILHKMKILKVFNSLRPMLYQRMIHSYNQIGFLASLEARHYERSDSMDLSPAERLHLLAAANLHELYQDGLYQYPSVEHAKEIVFQVVTFCSMRQNIGIRGRDEAQLIARLWRAIGHNDLAEDVVRRYGTLDQLQKAMT